MKLSKGSLTFAKSIVYLAGFGALSVLTVLLPELAREESAGKPADAQAMTLPFLLGAYVLAIPFFIALFQTHKFLQNIEKNNAFTKESIKILQTIKLCAIIFSLLIVVSVVSILSVAKMADPTEDVTFVITFGVLFTFVSIVVTVFVAVLQKVLTDAIMMKSENDLII